MPKCQREPTRLGVWLEGGWSISQREIDAEGSLAVLVVKIHTCGVGASGAVVHQGRWCIRGGGSFGPLAKAVANLPGRVMTRQSNSHWGGFDGGEELCPRESQERTTSADWRCGPEVTNVTWGDAGNG